MNRKELNALFARLDQVKTALIANGWVFQFSVMHDGGGLNYGSCFSKDGHELYLNKDTVEAYAIASGI